MNGMMTKLHIKLSEAADCMTYVKQLRESGLVQGTDFEFAYVPNSFDMFTGDVTNKQVIVSFADESTALFYKLKWL